MTPADARRFGDLWQLTAERTGGKPRSDAAVMADLEDLAVFDFEEVRAAVRAHLRRPGEQWMPKVGDIVQLIEGELPSNEAMVALAHAARTPLGKMLSVKLGTDMTRLHPRDLPVRMGTFRDYATDLHRRALVGDYTDIEIRTLVGAGIDPAGQLGPETAGPRGPFKPAVEARAAAARETLQIGTEKAAPKHRSKADSEAYAACMAKCNELLGGLKVFARPARSSDEQDMADREMVRVARETGERLFAERERRAGS